MDRSPPTGSEADGSLTFPPPTVISWEKHRARFPREAKFNKEKKVVLTSSWKLFPRYVPLCRETRRVSRVRHLSRALFNQQMEDYCTHLCWWQWKRHGDMFGKICSLLWNGDTFELFSHSWTARLKRGRSHMVLRGKKNKKAVHFKTPRAANKKVGLVTGCKSFFFFFLRRWIDS